MNGKKEKERAVLELFREIYNEFPTGVLSPSESPDFILSRTAKNKIGIELTRLHKASEEKDFFSYQNLSSCLIQKEEKLVLYRKKRLREYWLIILVPEFLNKPEYNLSNKLLNREFNTGFDRVFLFDLSDRKIFALKNA